MKRHYVIALAAVLAVIGAVVPIAAALYVAWHLAVAAEQERLALFANRVITRANVSLSDVRSVLRAMALSNLAPCSREHIAQMRRWVINTRAVDEVGYFENGLLKCTSWGPAESRIEQVPGDYATPDGIEVKISMRPLVTDGKPMMALQYGAYNVLIDPVRFVDVIVDPGIRLAVASAAGTLIAELHEPDRRLVESLLSNPRTGIDNSSIFATARGDGWSAIAIGPRDGMLAWMRRQQMILLPFGGFAAAFFVGVVIWFLRRRLSPLGELQIAVQNREFVVHYQPIVALKTGVCVGAEALVRWRRPDGELVRPDHFIPLAEESGLILPITDQIVDAVISDMNTLLVADRSFHIAINLSADDVKSGRALNVLRKAMQHTGIRPRQIWLEATERGFMDIDDARTTVTEARRIGHLVAIDDFGTGYSSLQYLQGLPLDALKIDKSFIDAIGRKAATSSVTAHIIEMAKELNLSIVAEGVETQAQLDYLLDHGVDYGQGWLFGKPLPAAEFIAFFRRSKDRSGTKPDVIRRVAA